MPARDGSGPPARQGAGAGWSARPGAGPDGQCVCPKCGHTVAHKRGRPCRDALCPKCGSPMVRK